MPDLTYTSTHTGQNLDDAIERALPLDTFAYYEDKAVSGVTYHILWKVQPTNSNTVYGIAVHPTNGKLYTAKSTNGTVTVTEVAKRGSYVTIGNASVGDTASIRGVTGSTTASKATAGTAQACGNADTGTKVSGIAKRSANKVNIGNADYDTNEISITGISGTSSATVASYDSNTKTLVLSSAISVPAADTTKTFHAAKQADNEQYVCTSDQVEIIPAKSATGTITPYTFADVTVPIADANATSVTSAVSSDTSGYICSND